MKKTIDPHTLSEVAEKICDNYCKYPLMDLPEDEFREICENCPLVRLEVEQ